MYFIEDEHITQGFKKQFNSSKVNPDVEHEKENVKLTDSLLEYHDPTPSIHDLFVRFDRRFFWGKLGMVEVKWSNRMTSCAGLCRYQGKLGLCSISLSAPLLSLRPRKDLVETLLHEMIHAYLFVTHNYKDREDHGPEFHKHMNRINEEAGTKITVYHSFMDEVAYYQKHIWRCNGPCQQRRPYFGFVKRAMNRPPGPYDTWWQQHQSTCGGTFIKISEPEKVCKKKQGHEKDKNAKTIAGVKDIRNFFPSPIKVPNKTVKGPMTKVPNIHTIKDLKKGEDEFHVKQVNQTNLKIPKIEVKDDNDLQTKVTSKSDDKKATDNESMKIISTVRNYWANKYPSTKTPVKRPKSPIECSPVDVKIEMKRKQITCPVCYNSFSETIINEHAEECLSRGSSAEASVLTTSINSVSNSTSHSPDSVFNTMSQDSHHHSVRCPVCGESLDRCELNEHLEDCLSFSFQDDFDENDGISDSVPCPCCMKCVSERVINDHIDECLTLIALKNELKN